MTQGQIDQIMRTVRRTPEVMVKVLSRGAENVKAVRRHFNYIGRKGELDLETDAGDRIRGRDAGEQLVEDWDLELESDRGGVGLASKSKQPPRLVHKIMLSMPPGTPANGVLEASRNFAREEFALKHRYALVLHTDEPHPHVHLVVKATSEQGVRLNIRKATLREWRREFARHLRNQGIAANATDRAVRGETRTRPLDGIFRADLRGDSSHTRHRVEMVASELRSGNRRAEPGKTKLIETRVQVERGWMAASEVLVSQGLPELAEQVRQFAVTMKAPRTDREQVAEHLLKRAKMRHKEERSRTR